jgi:hypothetical protein
MKAHAAILKIAFVALALAAAAVAMIMAGRAGAQVYQQAYPEIRQKLLEEEPLEPKDMSQEFPVPFQPLPPTITPCRACHGPEKDFPVDFRRREALLVHKNVKLNHGGVRVWCLDCHHPQERNYLLPLSDGVLIKFEQSYLLCGKCHGTKYRDWRYGIHGKRVGYWNGKKTYSLCVNCHDPHSPKFKPLQPMPPPNKPWWPKEKKPSH